MTTERKRVMIEFPELVVERDQIIVYGKSPVGTWLELKSGMRQIIGVDYEKARAIIQAAEQE